MDAQQDAVAEIAEDPDDLQFDDDDSEIEIDGPYVMFETVKTWRDTQRELTYTINISVYNSQEDEGNSYAVAGSITFKPFAIRLTGVKEVDRTIHSLVPKSQPIGYLQGALIGRRADGIFFGIVDEHNDEVLSICRTFCDRYGDGTRLNHPLLMRYRETVQDMADPRCLFHVYKVGIHPDHSGRDLGIRLIYETLALLEYPPVVQELQWSLAVLNTNPLGTDFLFASAEQGRETKKYWYPSGSSKEEEEEEEDEEETEKRQKAFDAAQTKVALQIARLGFAQAARNPEASDAWFLTREMFSGNDTEEESAESRWMSKRQAEETVDVYVRPRVRTPSKLDRQLTKVILHGKHSLDNAEMLEANKANADGMVLEHRRQLKDALVASLQEMIEKGASLDGARALHTVAARWKMKTDDPALLEVLLAQGADINQIDEMGCSPLHVAAVGAKYPVIKFLLDAGADSNGRNLMDRTPLDCVLDLYVSRQESVHYSSSESPKAIELMPIFESAKALMSQEQRDDLCDGMISPKMRLVLTAFSGVVRRVLADLLVNFTAGNTDVRSILDEANEYYLNYIPPSEIQLDYEPQSEYWRVLLTSYKRFWSTIWELLRSNHVPTVTAVRQKLETDHRVRVRVRHERWTGSKIEYALDALIACTKHVWDRAGDACIGGQGRPNPLDGMYDVAWVHLMTGVGGTREMMKPRGPHDWGRLAAQARHAN